MGAPDESNYQWKGKSEIWISVRIKQFIWNLSFDSFFELTFHSLTATQRDEKKKELKEELEKLAKEVKADIDKNDN